MMVIDLRKYIQIVLRPLIVKSKTTWQQCEKFPLERLRQRWEDKVKFGLREI
jgi:hypothetical protein